MFYCMFYVTCDRSFSQDGGSLCGTMMQGWLLHRTQQESDVLLGLFDRIYGDLEIFAAQNLTKKMVTLPCNAIVQVLRLSALRHRCSQICLQSAVLLH